MFPFGRSTTKNMPGLECALPGTGRGVNYESNFMQVYFPNSKQKKQTLYWVEEGSITYHKYRILTNDYKKQAENDENVYICKKVFSTKWY